jgi:hypothetical protein
MFQQSTNADIQFTPVLRQSLDPVWNYQLNFRNIDDENLQEKYFEITVMDSSQEKIIGIVYIDLGHLLSSSDEQVQKGFDAWFPIFNFEYGL